jgi:hypothetical protein
MIHDANGQFIKFSIRWDYYEKVVPFVVSTARQFKLDCYDPQAYRFYSAKSATVEALAHTDTPVTNADAAVRKARFVCGLDKPIGSSGKWQAMLVKDAKFGDEWDV